MTQQQITVAEVRRLLPTSKHRLDDELESFADTQERISAMVAEAAYLVADAKDNLARVEHEVADAVRRDAADRGVKITVDQVSGLVHVNRERSKAWRSYNEAMREHETWRGLYDAWRSKGFNMGHLGGLYANQYFAVSSVGRSSGSLASIDRGRQALQAARTPLRVPTDAEAESMPRAEPRTRRRAS